MDIQPLYQPRYAYLYGERRVEHVPRPPLYRPPAATFPGIDFFILPGQQGVLVKEILQNTAMIEDADDHVLEAHGWRSTVVNLELSINAKGPLVILDADEHLHIKWPGFVPTTNKNPMHARIDTRRNGHPITRLQFAQEICLLLHDFLKRSGKHTLAPGWERWSINPDTQGIRVSDLVLYSVYYYRNVWVPELYVK